VGYQRFGLTKRGSPYFGRFDDATQDVWQELFSHITRVMVHGHKYYRIGHDKG